MLLDRHRAKIVAAAQLAQVVGPRPRSRTVVMCNGVFDVVHPGHLRHLLYARQKADVLVCAVTSDRCAPSKGPYRPHVPQDMRTANLAMLDIVDYVVIADDERPDGLIALIEPDFYAKGFEYTEEVRGRPLREAAAVEAYGGEVLFTPGDIIYSSTTLVEAAAPDLRWDKLALLMRRAELSFDDLRAVVRAMREQSVHVVGDLIVDGVLRCEVIGTSGKTPTLSVRRLGAAEYFVGGAGVVAKHCRAAGATVLLTTVRGDDERGFAAVDDLREHGVHVYAVIERGRPTTVKEVVVAGGYRLLKIDEVDSRPISDSTLRQVGSTIAELAPAVTVFSDFRHGIFNARTIPELVAAVPEGCVRVADSQVASRWGNITQFPGFDLVTPNEREARHALGDQDSGVRSLGASLREACGARWLLMKLGARGLFGFTRDEGESFSLDSLASGVVDPVGAGDALLAYTTLAAVACNRGAVAIDYSAFLPAAAVLGSMAAAVECEYDGNVPVPPERVLAKIDDAEREISP